VAYRPRPPEFAKADISSFPPLTALPDDTVRCMWVMWVAKEALRFPWLTPSQVQTDYAMYTACLSKGNEQRRFCLRAKHGGTVARRVSGGRRYYQVMDAGIAVVRSVKSSVLFITPQQSLTAIRAVEDILGTLKGFFRVCDPYVDGRTLDWPSSCQQATKLDLLTTNIKNRTTTFARDLAAFNRLHAALSLDVKVLPPGVLHDRYFIDDGQLLLFGTILGQSRRL
jgi:hypothetical protein